MKCVLFQFDIITNTLLIMARLKQAYYGSCFVASCMHLGVVHNCHHFHERTQRTRGGEGVKGDRTLF